MSRHSLHVKMRYEGKGHPHQSVADMVRIRGGTFRMGSDKHYPEEAPAHRVTVDEFWIDARRSRTGNSKIRQRNRPRHLCRDCA